MRFIYLFFVFFNCFWGLSQVPDQEDLYHHPMENDTIKDIRDISDYPKKNDTIIKSNDLFYREDQFYLGVMYGLLQNKPQGISQNTFSASFHFGFLRDIPINKNRDIAIAIGLGYSFSNYRTNLHISKTENQTKYIQAENFDKNKLALHFLDIPIEFRWRTSTPKNINFWRVYSGIKFSYLTFSRSQIKGNFPTQTIKNNSDFNKFRYSVFLSIGHGSITFYVNYGLNSIFKNAYYSDDKRINMRDMSLGFMFYIL